MAYQFNPSSTGPWDVDRPPVDQDEADLQQVLWNNHLYLIDLTSRQTNLLVGFRKSSQYFIQKEHTA